jgi:hypothetical protein
MLRGTSIFVFCNIAQFNCKKIEKSAVSRFHGSVGLMLIEWLLFMCLLERLSSVNFGATVVVQDLGLCSLLSSGLANSSVVSLCSFFGLWFLLSNA